MRLATALMVPAMLSTALAGCARTETPEEARAAAARIQAEYDRGAAARSAAAGPEAEDTQGQIGAPVAEGEWIVTETGEGPVAAYGRDGEAAQLGVRCGDGGGLELRRPGIAVPQGALVSYVSLPEGESRLTASVDSTDATTAFLFVPPSDPFLERLIDSPGPITLRMGGERLAVPTSPALVGLVSSCGGDVAPAQPAVRAPAAPADRAAQQ